MSKAKCLRACTYIRNFLSQLVSKKFLTFLFFLFLSSVLWLMMTLNETSENEYYVPLTLVNVPKNAIITDNLPDTITVTVRDKGFNLFAYDLWHKIKPLKINFTDYANNSTEHGVIPINYVQNHVARQLYSASRIVDLNPNDIEFFFNYGLSKKVPVRLYGKVTPQQSYYIAKTTFTPDSVIVYASKHLLDSITYINTDYQHITNFQDTIVKKVSLQKIRGVKTIPAQIGMTLFPDILIEESIEVPITAINVPADKVLLTFPSKVKITFVVGASQIKALRPEQFTVIADYNSLKQVKSDKCNLYLRAYPQSVSKPKLTISAIDYLIEQQ